MNAQRHSCYIRMHQPRKMITLVVVFPKGLLSPFILEDLFHHVELSLSLSLTGLPLQLY